MRNRHVRTLALFAALGAASSPRLEAQSTPVPTVYDPIVVTATRDAQRAFDVPASVDVIDGAIIRSGQPAINLSESLVRVPGVFAANRQNYAQDLQISSRGFGARATFGVRGVRLYQDDIPVTMPDGQGQTGSFSLLSAGRIEVLRGPFSTLYGNASGGVISVYTENGTPEPVLSFTASAGSYDTVSLGVKATGIGRRRRVRGRVQLPRHQRLSRPFGGDPTDRQRQAHVRRRRSDPRHHHRQPAVPAAHAGSARPHAKPNGEADPRQADPVTTLFNTNKTISQFQGGFVLDHALTPRYERARDGLCGPADDRAVSRADRRGAHVVRRCRRSRPRLRRLRRAAHLERQRGRARRWRSMSVRTSRARRNIGRASSTTSAWPVRCVATRTIRVTGADAYAEARWYALDKLSSDARRALEPGPLRLRRSLRRRPRIRTTAESAPTTTRVRSPASSGTRRTTSTVLQLRPGLRDADVRGARVQPGRCRVSTSISIRRRPPPMSSG